MRWSDERILTTHTGSLPRPPELTRLYVRRARGEAIDPAELVRVGKAALRRIVDKQIEAGVDIGNDGRVLHFTNRAHHFQVRSHRQDVGVGHRIGCRQLKAAAPDRVKAGIRRELGGKGIVRRHRERRLADIELGAQRCGLRIVLRHKRSVREN